MKKILLTLLILLVPFLAKASDPTLIPITDQLQFALLSHVTAVGENTTHGQLKMAFLDGIIQAGHFRGDYIIALDAGAVNNTLPDAQGNIAGTVGIHVHVLSALAAMAPISPSLQNAVQLLELNPRYSWDADVRHGVASITFGAKIPFN